MSASPFLTLRIRRRADTLRLRQQARRVACLLRFGPHEQVCVAAGAFLVACEALEKLGSARVCFQIERAQLHVSAQGIGDESGQSSANPPPRKRRTKSKEQEGVPLPRLVKDLPPEQPLLETDVAWLIQGLAEIDPKKVFDEITQQNREVLALLHELRSCQARIKQLEEAPTNPSAA